MVWLKVQSFTMINKAKSEAKRCQAHSSPMPDAHSTGVQREQICIYLWTAHELKLSDLISCKTTYITINTTTQVSKNTREPAGHFIKNFILN